MVNPRSALSKIGLVEMTFARNDKAQVGANRLGPEHVRLGLTCYLALSWGPLRFIEIATDCSSVPGAWIEIDCWLALVLTPSVAEMTPETRRLMALPRALPSMLPPTPRVVS